MSLEATKALMLASTMMRMEHEQAMKRIKEMAEVSLNGHVTNFMTQLRATYPGYDFDFYESHIGISETSEDYDEGADLEGNGGNIIDVYDSTKVDADNNLGDYDLIPAITDIVEFMKGLTETINVFDNTPIIEPAHNNTVEPF